MGLPPRARRALLTKRIEPQAFKDDGGVGGPWEHRLRQAETVNRRSRPWGSVQGTTAGDSAIGDVNGGLQLRLREVTGNHLRLACTHTVLVTPEATRQHGLHDNRVQTAPAALPPQRPASCLGCREARPHFHRGLRRHA